MNKLKKDIDYLNEYNRQVQMELDGKQNQYDSILLDYGKIIMSIKNIYLQYAIDPNQIKENDRTTNDTTTNLLYKLNKI